MYLKTLELQGFKSFPDKTVIHFEPGITAIVGANGSGKSNISDAVRWVLGEMSPKSLRSGKMEDVIFNGTAKRKPSGFAEVVLTIDNSDQLMKIDYDEVSVSRRLYRTGDSEYAINKQKCRLKDIVDLFLNTGIGREGYSIISQGRISEIISIKGSDRRDIFEEAAGISRFRYRKTEANAKLMQVSENSQRIGDILAEVEGRLPSLARQSEKAVKYLELAEEKRALEIAFWAQRLKTIEATEEETGKDFAAENKKLAAIADRLAELEAKLDSVYVESQKKNLRATELTDRIAARANEKTELSSRLSVLENDIYHFTQRIESARKGEAELEARRTAAGEEKARLLSELEEKKENCRKALEELKGTEEQLNALEERLQGFLREQDELLAQKEALEQKLHEQEMSSMEKKGFSQARTQRLSQIDRELEARKELRAKKEAAIAEAKKQLESLEDRLDELKDERDELRARQTAAAEALTGADEKKRALDLKYLEINQRKETLLRMERLLEGFSGSVKEVMNAFERKELSGIHGPVSRLIKTDEQYVTAIETALGAGIQNVVVEDERAAKAAIEYLKRTRSGRATFLPLTTLKPNVTDLSSIRQRGLVGNAVDLVKFDKKFTPAIQFLLGRTAVAENIDCATAIAASRNYSLRVVTLDGQLINAGGSFTGGQQLHKTGMLSRTADIARLEEECAAIKKKLDLADGEVKELVNERNTAADKLKRTLEKLDALRTEIAATEGELRVEEELLENMRLADEALERETEELRAAGVDQEEILRRLEQKKKELAEAIENNDALLSDAATRIRALSREKQEMTADRIRREGECRHRDSLREQKEKELRDLEERESLTLSEGEDLRRQVKELEDTIEESKKQIEESKQLLEATDASLAKDKAELEELRREITLLEKETFDGRAAQKEETLAKDRQTEVCTELKIKLDALATEKEGFLLKLREEYELERDSEEFTSVPPGEAERLGGEVRLIYLRKEIKKLGNVNTDSVAEYKETKDRYDFVKKQYDDIITSKNELEKLILTLEKTMREMFIASFDQIRACFKETFVQLFGGGTADIVLTDKDDILNCGIEIQIQPPGKLVKNLSLLSGGEQAFVAIALYFAILKVNPTPFCIFDEIESALDEANIYRFADYLKKNCNKTQFVVITHRRGTMEFADVLYGITMQEKGVSDFIRLDAAALEMFQTE